MFIAATQREGMNTSKEQKVVIKFDKRDDESQLKNEIEIYEHLQKRKLHLAMQIREFELSLLTRIENNRFLLLQTTET